MSRDDLDGSDPSDEDRSGGGGGGGGLAESLGRILRSEEEGDFLIAEATAVEEGILRWLQALDLQVLGACRADERLKPLLKLNASVGTAEEHLLAQLNQYFDAAEVGMLIRCLCVPLLSMRVGKVNKIGSMLIPTNIRGNLNIMLSPLSEMRLLFCGDDGSQERLGVVNNTVEGSKVLAEGISGDRTGRSFVLKLPGDKISYFWSSEKSLCIGHELLEKMNDLFVKKPSLAQLTGISESRLDSFASCIVINSFSSKNANELKSGIASDASTSASSSSQFFGMNNQLSSSLVKPYRARQISGQIGRLHPLYQGSLSPRSSAFKDGPGKTLTLRNCVREKSKRRVESSSSPIVDESLVNIGSSARPSSCQSLKDQTKKSNLYDTPLSLPISSPSALPLSSIAPLFPNLPISSPCYCWCQPSTSLQHVVSSPSLLSSWMPESITLPSLSSLPLTSLGANDLHTFNSPSLLPSSSFMSMPKLQPLLPTFTPFVADPIVHIPVIEVCSGPGYLVSAGPAISTSIPLLPILSGPLATETDSIEEKNARETLRMLMASTPALPQLMKAVPTVFTSVDENISYIHCKKKGLVVSGGIKGSYSGTESVDAIASSISHLRLTPYSRTDICEFSDGSLAGVDCSYMQCLDESESEDTDSVG